MGMSIHSVPVTTLAGEQTTLGQYAGQALLVVNVASRCGMTPQYEGLERLQKNYGERGFSVIGVPCNQFGGQEPGTAEEIETFCSTTYGISFPMLAKTDVNGSERHPLYTELTTVPDTAAPPVTWAGTSRSSWCRRRVRSSAGSAAGSSRSHPK